MRQRLSIHSYPPNAVCGQLVTLLCPISIIITQATNKEMRRKYGMCVRVRVRVCSHFNKNKVDADANAYEIQNVKL